MGKQEKSTHCGYIAIIGRPNVGKSTLLNRLIGEKVSITARKPQTTRYKILGIKTVKDAQMLYIDTPGLYRTQKRGERRTINRYMLKTSLRTIADIDVIIFLTDALVWHEDDEWILNKLKSTKSPIILAINKTDRIKSKTDILFFIKKMSEKNAFAELIPISAKTGFNIDAIEKTVLKFLPENHFLFPEDQITDRDERFLISEIIREKLIRFLGEELPYVINVQIEKYEQKNNVLHLHALIWVEKETQKAIVIGASGLKLKQIGSEARKELERLLGRKIFLKLWVKVKSGWTEDEHLLKRLGY